MIKHLITLTWLFSLMLATAVRAEIKLDDFLAGAEGEFALRFFHYTEASHTEPHRRKWEAMLKLNFTGELFAREESPAINFTLKPVLRADSVGQTSHVLDEKTERHSEYYALNLDEAFITISGEASDWNIGKQIFSWGMADAYNPTDNLNPLVLIDIPDRTKIGVPALSWSHDAERFSLDMAVMPWFTPARLPGSDNRWRGDFDRAAIFPGIPVMTSERELPGDEIKNLQWAVQVRTSELMPGWDWALNFFDGIDPAGVLRADPTPYNILLTQVYPDFREFGFSFSTLWGRTLNCTAKRVFM